MNEIRTPFDIFLIATMKKRLAKMFLFFGLSSGFIPGILGFIKGIKILTKIKQEIKSFIFTLINHHIKTINKKDNSHYFFN